MRIKDPRRRSHVSGTRGVRCHLSVHCRLGGRQGRRVANAFPAVLAAASGVALLLYGGSGKRAAPGGIVLGQAALGLIFAIVFRAAGYGRRVANTLQGRHHHRVRRWSSVVPPEIMGIGTISAGA